MIKTYMRLYNDALALEAVLRCAITQSETSHYASLAVSFPSHSLSTLRLARAFSFRARCSNRILRRRSFAEATKNLDDFEYRRAFRMDRDSLDFLCNLLSPYEERDEKMGLRSIGGS